MSGPELLFFPALPRIEIEGSEDPLLATNLVSIEMTETAGGLCAFEARVRNSGQIEGREAEFPFETAANAILTLGKILRLVAGDTNDPQEIFQGAITGLELVLENGADPHLIVLAEDKLQSARMARRTKLHETATLDDLVSAVAQATGLQVVSAGLTQPVGLELQLNETDLGFLRRVCARFDTDIQVVGTELHVTPRRAVDRGELALEFGVTLTRVRVLADLADQVTGISLSGYDPEAGDTFQLTAGSGADSGPGTGQTGAALLQPIFGARVEHLGAVSVQSRAEAQAIADAMLSARARRFVTLEGTGTGDPRLRVGTVVALAGCGPRFDNKYYVTQVQHRYDQSSGYQVDFRAESAFWGGS